MLTAQLLADVSPFSLGLAVAFMLLVESLSPLVPLLPPRERARHTLRNLSIAVFLASVAVIGNLLIMGLAAWVSLRGYGLLNLSDTPWHAWGENIGFMPGGNVSDYDIFVSYAHEDRERAQTNTQHPLKCSKPVLDSLQTIRRR